MDRKGVLAKINKNNSIGKTILPNKVTLCLHFGDWISFWCQIDDECFIFSGVDKVFD